LPELRQGSQPTSGGLRNLWRGAYEWQTILPELWQCDGSYCRRRFYLGNHLIGVCQLVLNLFGFFTCGAASIAAWAWGLIEGIMILIGSINKDSEGRPLVS
jgi:hypothetical protein